MRPGDAVGLPRRRPDPVPAVHPLPEYEATGELARRYEDMKAVLQVPWMGVVTMAFAHYPTFFETLWGGLREGCAGQAFVHETAGLRSFAEDQVAGWSPPPLADRLAGAGYGARELDRIREAIEVFSHGNPPYLVIATAARLLLEGGAIGPTGPVAPFAGRHGPAVVGPLVLMEAHHADAPTQAVYADIKASLGLPIVNTDYRALARWPSYFALAWSDLRSRLPEPAYAATCAAIHDRTMAIARALPNPAELDSDRLRRAAADADPAEVLEVVRLFQWLLPGLVANVAFFRAQLS